jgi:hypothetical protein
MCILRDLPHQKKNPRALLCQGSLLNFCSHVPMEIFLFLPNEKEAKEIKRELFIKGEVPILVHSPEVPG